MIVFFLVLLSFSSFVALFNPKNETCLLPFVIKPCLTDRQILSCTFSLDSSERTRTCRLLAKNLIFTTFHLELFLIPTYYDLIFRYDQRIITKLIIEPNVSKCTFEYLHWTEIRILSIEFPADDYQFALIHQKNTLDINRTRNDFNQTYWHLQMMIGTCDACERTVFTLTNFTTMFYECPHMSYEPRRRICGDFYACFHDRICHATGYRRLVCLVNIIRPWMHFFELSTMSQYEVIFIGFLQSHPNSFHAINETAFARDRSTDGFLFQTKRLVVVIDKGILHLSSKLFNYPEYLQVGIEHGPCHADGFRVDILNEASNSISDKFLQLDKVTIGAVGCHLNISE